MPLPPRTTLLPLLALLAGCSGPDPRAAGPLESEWGRVTYWRVESATAAVTGCTDAPAWAEVVATPQIAVGSFFIYRLSTDGQSAVGQKCSSTDSSTCTDLDQIYAVSDHELVYEAAASTVQKQGACEVVRLVVWTILDQGERGAFTARHSFGARPSPESCQALEQELQSSSPNGRGVLGCLVQADAQLAFAGAKPAPTTPGE
ncbi:MAG: hypothetical protein HY744_00510 [Deltaproteobacteria bacterium]|nr:hypothetical protein [Deltaproteobacteria bacterium]